MSSPYLGEIRIFGGNFAPAGWAFCQGQLMPISQYSAVFALLGTTYGGDGQSTFALPDLRSRLPIHQGQGPGLSNYAIGQAAGVENITLTTNQLPAHAHSVAGATGSTSPSTSPVGNVWTDWSDFQYSDQTPNALMSGSATTSAGNGQPHSNIPPVLTLNYIIALAGIFPSRS